MEDSRRAVVYPLKDVQFFHQIMQDKLEAQGRDQQDGLGQSDGD